jgi:hypothetical protein
MVSKRRCEAEGVSEAGNKVACPLTFAPRGKEIPAMKEQLTAVFQQVPEGCIAFVEELPGANTQGDTLEEARANLIKPFSWCWSPIEHWLRKASRTKQ